MTTPLFHSVDTYREEPRVDLCWRCSCGAGKVGYLDRPTAEIAASQHRFEEIARRVQLPPVKGAA